MSRLTLHRRPFDAPFISTIARDVDHLQESIQRMFEKPLAVLDEPIALPRPVGWYPPVDVSENDKELVMTAELPGLDLNDVKVDVDGDVLTVRGEKRTERTEGDRSKEYYLEERTYGAFQRSFTLPSTVDAARINATFDRGVLTLRMPKSAEPKPRGREIPIAAGASSNGPGR